MELEIFRDAEALAVFSNLDQAGVDYFRNNYPGFFPDRIWDVVRFRALEPPDEEALDWEGQPSEPLDESPHIIWRQLQNELRRAWQQGFPLEASIALLSDTWHHGFPGEITDRGWEPRDFKPKAWPYQKAVMFLAVDAWRARVCLCGKRFVADKPSRRFCSEACSANARKVSRRAWWTGHGRDWRAGQEQQKRKPKGKRGKKR